MLSRQQIANLIMNRCEEILEYEPGLGVCGSGTAAYKAADDIIRLIGPSPGVAAISILSDPQAAPARGLGPEAGYPAGGPAEEFLMSAGFIAYADGTWRQKRPGECAPPTAQAYTFVPITLDTYQALADTQALGLAAASRSGGAETTEALVARLEHELGAKGINAVFRKALAMAKEAAANAKLPKGLVGSVSDDTIREIDGLNRASLAPHAAAPHMPGPGYRTIRAGALAGEARQGQDADEVHHD